MSSSFWVLRPFQSFLESVENAAHITIVSGKALNALRSYLPTLMLPLFVASQELWQIRNRILHPPQPNRFQPSKPRPILSNVQQILRFPRTIKPLTTMSNEEHPPVPTDTDFPDWTQESPPDQWTATTPYTPTETPAAPDTTDPSETQVPIPSISMIPKNISF